MRKPTLEPAVEGGLITAIRPLPSDPATRSIRVENRVIAHLPSREVDALGLEEGRAWRSEDSAAIDRLWRSHRAKQEAFRLLGRRPMTRKKVRDRLLSKGHGEAIVDEVLDRLVDDGWLDDRAFALEYARELLRRRSAGPRLVRAKLEEQGVSAEIIDRTLDSLNELDEPVAGSPSADPDPGRAETGESPTIERALLLAERRLKQWRGLERPVQMRRVAGLLARRGYDEDQTRLVLERLGLSPDVV